MGKVASEYFRWKTTLSAEGVSIDLTEPSRAPAGPFSSLILMVRSKEYLTSSEVRLSPLLNFSPDRRMQEKVRLSSSSNWQLSAASGCGLVEPSGKASSDWKTLLKTIQEPTS